MARIVIVGAGLAGLSCALLLNRNGYEVTVIEKNDFPFHKVCGEYISNEVLPYLQSFGIDVHELYPSKLTRLKITSLSGRQLSVPLDLGGVGLSRFKYDNLLYEHALRSGIIFKTRTKVHSIQFRDNEFEVLSGGSEVISCDLVIGAFGKRSNLDQKLKRSFFYRRSPFMAVKYHLAAQFDEDLIELDLFRGGYSGICKIEEEMYSLCYLLNNDVLRRHQTIAEVERRVLFENESIRRHFKEGQIIGRARVINEISFERKPVVEGHILCCGDAAGMISPFCGNGMAMAIHAGKILGECISRHLAKDRWLVRRDLLEQNYRREWNAQFLLRLGTGRVIQKTFLHPFLTEVCLTSLRALPLLGRRVLKKTHGNPF